MLHVLRMLGIAVFGVWCAGHAAAQSGSKALLDMQSEHEGWDAIGRLELNGLAFCTGALIAEDLVLTAAHCLFDPDTGLRLPDERIKFTAAWKDGRARADRRVRRAIAHPDYNFADKTDPNRIRNDVALLQLRIPIRPSQIVPFATDAGPQTGARIEIVSYVQSDAGEPALQDTCLVKARQNGVLVMSCEVDFGASGAPVVSLESGQPRIVSVVSAKAEANGAPVSLGTALATPLNRLRSALAAENAFAARLERTTDATFLRP